MKTSKVLKHFVAIFLCICLTSCEDFLEIDAPDHKIINKTVFSSDEIAISAMVGIYNQLFAAPFSSGGPDSVSALGGLSSDELTTIRTNNQTYLEFDQNNIQPGNPRNLNLWSSSYNIIYMTNSLLEGLGNSEFISPAVSNKLEGEAKFIRAFTYLNLVNLYGEVPLILTTDYRENALASRDTEEKLYHQIVKDLQEAIILLDDMYVNNERTYVNHFAATALLARVHLYLENWKEATNLSSEVIDQSGTYEMLQDLNQVFLANSKEAIWQLSPKGRGNSFTNTNDAATFIIGPLTFSSHLKLSNNFVASFKNEDKRFFDWIGYHEGTSSYFSNKYKIKSSTDIITEYSMVLRLAEQFLIRAEAKVMQGDLTGAMEDLDVIRNRAGLVSITEVHPAINQSQLLDSIMEERKKELFTEWGHRWFDLKRTGRSSEVLSANPLWENFSMLYPIPEAERSKNPNLTQNDGY